MVEVTIVTNQTEIVVNETVVDVEIFVETLQVDLGNSGVPGIQGPPGSGGSGSGWVRDNITSNTVLTSAEANTIFDNTNAVAVVPVTLPTANSDYLFGFIDSSGLGWELTVGGQTIRIGDEITASGGTIKSLEKGSSVILAGLTGIGYIGVNAIGAWGVV